MMTSAAILRAPSRFDIPHSARKTSVETPVFRSRPSTDVPAPQEPSPRRERRPLLWFASGLVAATAVASQPWKAFSSRPEMAESEAVDSRRAVSVVTPSAGTTASVVLPATVRPWQTTALYARVGGYLAAWHADLGTSVKGGELLAEIDTPELDQETAAGEASAREAEAAVVQARAERVEAEADLKVAEAQLVRIQAEAELARSQLARREKLLAGRNVSQEEYETAARQVESRTADVAAAESDVVRRRSNLDTRAAIIDVREATAKSRRATVNRLKELQVFKRIIAPFDGVVTSRTAEVGMLVTAGKEALFVVEDMSRVRVQMDVPQTYAARTYPGVTAVVVLPESMESPVAGTITRVADSVDAKNRTMLAEIELENVAHRLQPGSYVHVTLTTSQNGSSWTVPTNTLSMRVNGPHVVVVDDQERIELRRVSLGRDLGKRVVVVEGLRGDERLVVNPADDLANGRVVRVEGSQGVSEVASR